MPTAMASATEHDEAPLRRMEPLHEAPDLSSFLDASVSLKDQVVEATWHHEGGRCVDPTAHSGLLGTAFLCLRAYEATGSRNDLELSSEIVDACAVSAQSCRREVTFLCGAAGVYALGAVVANYRNDRQRRELFLDLFFEVAQERALSAGPEEGGFGMSYDLLHGRAGFLFAALFVNKHVAPGTVPDELLHPVVQAVLAGGRAGAADHPSCPLMYRWHGTRFWGAAHGLAGILQLLLHFQLGGQDLEDVKGTVRYMIRNRLEPSGNYPSSECNCRDKLVQWSHGAGGVAIMLCRAAQVFQGDPEICEAAVEAGEVVWKRGLVPGGGLSDGIAGNAYSFLSLYRLTKESAYLDRAKAFAGFLCHNAGELVGSDVGAYSLLHGLAGVGCLMFDMAAPETARFPGFEL